MDEWELTMLYQHLSNATHAWPGVRAFEYPDAMRHLFNELVGKFMVAALISVMYD